MSLNEFLKKAIGVPWTDKGRDISGWDCWGLVINFYREVFNVDLNPLDGISFCTGDAKESLKVAYAEVNRWSPCDKGSEKIGDVIILRPFHTGIVLGDGKMLHCEFGLNTCMERYISNLWKNRIIGFYRHDTQRW